jgi:DNA-binding MltR family transcriptional regulator
MSSKNTPPKKKQKSEKPSYASIDPFFTAIDRGDDFARIVVGGAKVDACVMAILDKVLVDGGTKDSLLSHSGVLGNFAARASLCYTLGHISKLAYSDMMILAYMRNISAHSPKKVSFDEEEIREQIRQLKWFPAWLQRNYGTQPRISDLLEFFEEQLHEKYNTTIGILCTELNAIAGTLEKRTKYEEPLSKFHAGFYDKNGNPLNELPEHIKVAREHGWPM